MTPTDPTAATHAPLSGLRVLDLTRVLAGPFCTMILADLGAEVVKVERPETGDDARHFGPFLPSGESAYFASINRGKKSIVLDLRSDTGRQTLLELAAGADVLVENFRPGTLQSAGFGVETLKQKNPRLIVASVSGFGQTGERSRQPAYDIIVQAMSGLMSITGHDRSNPVRVGTSIADLLSGLFSAIGILATLQGRERHGQGAHLDVAMLDCAVAALENAVSRFAVTGEPPEPLGTRHPSIAPFQAFTTSDEQIVVAAGNDLLWRKLCQVLGDEALARDPRLADNRSRCTNLDYMEAELNLRFARHPAGHWLSKLQEAGIPAAPIRNVAEVAADPHLAERNMLHTMEDATGATFLTAGSPLRIDGRNPPLSRRPPALGQHTAEVLSTWLGK